jgi:hypothetical protein
LTDAGLPAGPPAVAARRRWPETLAAVALVAAPLVAAWIGARGPQTIVVNLGPGDAPYVTGFAPEYEIDDKVGTHWTTYHAAVDAPVEVRGPAALAYRYARVFGETAQVDVSFPGRPVDHFAARGGAVLERRTDLGVLPPTRLHVGVDADSHERKDRSLKLDWIRLDLGPDSRVRLLGLAAVRPALVVVLVLALHLLAGWDLRRAVALTAPWSAAAVVGLVRDPWLTHRLLRGIPPALVLFGGAGMVAAAMLRRRGRLGAGSLRTPAALAMAAFLLRALAVNHPDFYYPDLRTHARLVEKVQQGGLDFFVHPSRYIWEHGVWRTEAYGKTYAFPYTPAFHLTFAALNLSYDTCLVAMKLAAAALSVVPILLTWVLARRLGASPLGAALLVLVPTYTSRLSFAFLPALLGHVFDLALVLWLAGHLDSIRAPRTWATGAAWVAACQLAYVSGVMNTAALVAALILVALVRRRPREAGALAAMGLLGAAVAVALYYRDFLGMVLDVLPRAAGHGVATASRYSVEPFWRVAFVRTRDFFDTLLPLLAAAGLVALCRGGGTSREDARVSPEWRRGLLLAWLAAYALLLLGRARMPDVFLHGHETLLVTPLVCLAAGHALALVGRRSHAGRLAAAAAVALLAVQGLVGQWQAVAAQLANAR